MSAKLAYLLQDRIEVPHCDSMCEIADKVSRWNRELPDKCGSIGVEKFGRSSDEMDGKDSELDLES